LAEIFIIHHIIKFIVHILCIYKFITLEIARISPGQQVLDLASGTGDLALSIAPIVGPKGHVVLSDINKNMLNIGRDRLIDKGFIQNVSVIVNDAQSLPFPNNRFHVITIAYGLRNIPEQSIALQEMYRVLKPGGQLCILEFSNVNEFIKPLYDLYSFHVLPPLGQWITGHGESYQYLVESIRKHPNQQDLKHLLETAGFEAVNYYNLSGGIVAIHQGYKY